MRKNQFSQTLNKDMMQCVDGYPLRTVFYNTRNRNNDPHYTVVHHINTLDKHARNTKSKMRHVRNYVTISRIRLFIGKESNTIEKSI